MGGIVDIQSNKKGLPRDLPGKVDKSYKAQRTLTGRLIRRISKGVRGVSAPTVGAFCMKNLKEITDEWELLFTGLGVFVGLPFLASFLLGRQLEDLLPGLLISIVVFVILFALVATGGLKRLSRRRKASRTPASGKVNPPPKWTPEDAVNLYRYLRESGSLKEEQPMTDEEALTYFKQNSRGGARP